MDTKKPRGSIFLFTVVLVIPLMLVIAGFAVDVALLFSTRSELHRAMDAAALAGAGKLGFDSTDFPAARQFAQNYAASNKFSQTRTISLNLNTANNPAGDIVLGIWDGAARTFTPSLDGTVVNAVQCRTTQSIPTYFLNMVGLTSLSTSALSIAISNPPNNAPGCVFPIGVTTCQFFNGSAWSSLGCGTSITFTTSSGQITGTTSGTNTAAWVNLLGGSANGPYLIPAITAAANGTCTSNPLAGQTVNASNGMENNVMDSFVSLFTSVYNSSPVYTINGLPDSNGNPTTAYKGKGWEVYVPLIATDCPPKDVNQSYVIQTFAKFIFTQAIHHKACVVSNPADTNTSYICSHSTDPTYPQEAIFGYFDCATLNVTPTPIPTPRAALGTRLRLVQ
jgi:Flp pilus assembly protein TadG